MSRVTQDTAMPHFASHTGLSPSMVTFSKVFCSRFAYNVAVLQPQQRLATPLVWAVPRSLATTRRIVFTFFSYGYLDVSVPHVRLRFADNRIASVGLPHSDICGSMSICLSPQLFAACHVLLRLREPRHPPCALSLLRCSVRKEH